ncbi:hypothetical protein [Methanobrevibacter filiformis]|uniref:Phage-like element PBSX protein XkdF domain-containing protein n=1 Tax=Methanobrevibacter filiformis TaxID=55758 RepID=A0A166FAC1_9EURY|nr:hypothetical protein [Methanobrevibacter filiformis]KZX17464.1 hypothetical protein MBFIL_01220 [Methanobrevibacter filiformis]
MKVHDDDTWNKIENEEYTGLSVTVTPENVADALVAGKSRTLIKDVPNPVAATIAFVDKPCVHKATFCSVKSINSNESYESKHKLLNNALRNLYRDKDVYAHILLTFDTKIIAYMEWQQSESHFEIPYSINVNGEVEFGEPLEVQQEYVAKKMLEKSEKDTAIKAGRSISDSTYTKIKKAWDSLGNLINKAENERTENVIKGDKMTDNNEKEYVTKSDLENLKTEILTAVKSAQNNESTSNKEEDELTKLKKENADLKKKLESSNKSDETKNEETDPEEIKGASKSIPNHETNDQISKKSTKATVLEAMGRNSSGLTIKK